MNQMPEKGGAPLPPTAGALNLPVPVPETAKKEDAIPFSRIDLLFAGLAVICGWIFTKTFSAFFGMGITVFALAVCVFALCYFRVKQISLPRESFFWLGVYLLSAFNFSMYSNFLLGFLNFWFLLASGAYWLAVCTSVRIGGCLDRWILSDVCRQIFRIPFGNFGCGFRLLGMGLRQTKKGRGVFGILGGLAVSIPVLGIILPMLVSADGNFERIAHDFAGNLWRYIGDFLWQLPIAILVGCWLFGLIYGDVHRRKTEEPTADQLRQRAETRHVLPVSMMGTMFAIVIVVYAVFFAAQIQSLMDAFLSFSPEGGSYSEYARRGFFELCFVSGFNLFLLLCSKGFSVRRDGKEPGTLKALHGILCAETLILIASALGKMAMYISRYGLTQLRFYTSWFMVTLAIVFIVLLISGFRRIRMAKILTVTVIVSFQLLCWCNPNALIVSYNISRWESGTLETLDLEDMRVDMPESAIPQLISLRDRTSDPQMRDAIDDTLQNDFWGNTGSSWIDHTLESILSQNSLNDLNKS